VEKPTEKPMPTPPKEKPVEVKNVFNKNNLKQVVEVKPVPSNRVGTAQPQKERQERLEKEKKEREDRHKAMVEDIRKKQEDFKPAKPLNVFEARQPAK
jgi:hypothetical protein